MRAREYDNITLQCDDEKKGIFIGSFSFVTEYHPREHGYYTINDTESPIKK